MKNNGLPAGANQWARDVESAMATLGQLQEIARRICTDFGLDIANPTRGLNTGANAPSVQNPVQLKLPSLQDLDIRDAQDGDLLTFDGARGVWVARRHDTVQLPKEFPEGDPASYYVEPDEPAEPGVIPADTWSIPFEASNVVPNPSFENNLSGWAQAVGGAPGSLVKFHDITYVSSVEITREAGAGEFGGAAMRATATGAVRGGFTPASWGVSIPVPVGTNWVRARMKYVDNADWNVGFIFETPRGLEVYSGYWENFDPDQGSWLNRDHNMRYGVLPPEDATAEWVYVGGKVYAGTPGTTSEVLVDSVFATSDQWNSYFDGDTVAYHTTYSWDGTPGNSTSHFIQNQRLHVPAEFPENSVIEVAGEGFKPNSTIAIPRIDIWGTWKEDIPTDASGNFATTLEVGDVGAPISGPFYVYDGDNNSAYVPVQITAAEG